ncbi:MAG TPA: PAS domain S-box protein [Bradyrhizobium sp.]|nr:PAS domain S-box protein [Bradyrhizobium sp.]
MHSGQQDRHVFLSTLPATRGDRVAALWVVGVSAVLFALAVPYAGTPLTPVPAFVAGYQSALATSDTITAVLLFSQFTVLRSRALLMLSSGYLFTACAALVHALTFPGLFAPNGLLGAGPQTTVWLYMAWHGGFPFMVLLYALTKDRGTRVAAPPSQAILVSLCTVAATIVVIAYVVTVRHDVLPVLLAGGHYTPTMIGVVTVVWCLSLVALAALFFRKSHTVLDVWLMVVMCAWLFDIALSAIVNVARFDLGFYAGRIYGLAAATFVLAVLLFDNVTLQAQMTRLVGSLRRQAASERDYYSERERLFSAVVESSHDAIITKSLDGTITAWNRAAEQLFGHMAADVVGKHIRVIVPPERRDEMYNILDRIGHGETIEARETQRLHKSGRIVDVMLTIAPLRAASGQIIGASKIARDITDSKRTQSELMREAEERQRIFETSQDLILVTDPVGTFVQVSPSSTAIVGYRPEEMIGRSAVEFIHPDDLAATRDEMRAARRGKQKRAFEARYVHKDGHDVFLSWTGTWSPPVRRHFFIGRDVTEQRAAETQLRHAQKMDAVGQLTGGVAHDFNNILTVITGTIGILQEAVADRPELVSIARLIDDAAERGAQLTRHLLAFARKQPLQPREIDVNALVLEAAKLLRPTLGEQIEIQSELASETWAAMVDPSQLTTAVINLSLNARDAMPEGGKLTLETRNVYLDETYAGMHSEVAAGHYIMVAVSDTGSGITPENLEKVFEPFFTTKEIGKGTGLGLSMVFGFIKQSGGHVKIYSEVGHGTSVKMYLPRATGLGEEESDAPAAPVLEGGNETVLIVEDDAMVRRYVLTQVRSLGYEALEAANAAEALAIIDGNPAIDLLFTDVIMPGAMNGRQLADAATQRRPGLKTLFTSGYTENAILHHGRLDPGVHLLAKPYRKPELARMIRLALSG